MTAPRRDPGGSTSVVKQRMTKDEAQTAGVVPLGHVWDEQTQQPIPLGAAIEIAAQERAADPGVMMKAFDDTRTMILQFVREKMQAAEVDQKGYLVEGKLHHFYVVPSSTRKALTKTGAELLASLFRLQRSRSEVTNSVETAEYVSARVHCELVDRWGKAAGAHEGACSSAEPAFRSPGARKKYGAQGKWEGPQGDKEWVEKVGPDYRAALNDIVAKAGKRAFVGAVIVATATDEIFEVPQDDGSGGNEDEDHGQERSAETGHRPQVVGVTFNGKPVSALTMAELERYRKRLTDLPEHQWDKHREALDVELDARRTDPGAGGKVEGSDLRL